MQPLGAENKTNKTNTKINWEQINTIFLDMDGTLLDLNFDLHFWHEYLPLVFAQKHNLSHQQAKHKIYPMLKAEEGKLHWYCLDYWGEIFKLDIAKLKADVAHLIKIHPFVLDFLIAAKTHNKRIYLITNAHRKTIKLKMRLTNLEQYFDEIISSHDYGIAKEELGFWQHLNKMIKFDKQKSIFFDDSLSVLNTAKNFGINTIIAISKPSSKIQSKPLNGFINIENFAQIIPPFPH